jgi:tartrate dehydratase beta subunit/fumarate hydratase class I family protein
MPVIVVHHPTNLVCYTNLKKRVMDKTSTGVSLYLTKHSQFRNATHAFRIHEIAMLIFMNVYLEKEKVVHENEVRTCSDLISVACTCRHFHDLATDILWRIQVSLFPLFRCFPPNIDYFPRGSDHGLEDLEVNEFISLHLSKQ